MSTKRKLSLFLVSTLIAQILIGVAQDTNSAKAATAELTATYVNTPATALKGGIFTHDNTARTIKVGASNGKLTKTDENVYFAYMPVDGDFTVMATINSSTPAAVSGSGYSNNRSMIMMKNGLDATSPQISTLYQVSDSDQLQAYRRVGTTVGSAKKVDAVLPTYVKVSRAGTTYTTWYATKPDYSDATQQFTMDDSVNMGQAGSTLNVGLAVCSATTEFQDVRIIQNNVGGVIGTNNVLYDTNPIVNVNSIPDISVAQGTNLASILPKTVSATYSDGTSKQTDVTWTNTDDVKLQGTYSIKGTVAGITGNVTAKVKVVPPAITSTVPLTDIKMIEGSVLNLPKTVTATYSDGTTKDVDVTWTNSQDVDVNKMGIYTVNGKVANFSDTVTVKVIVNSAVTIITDISPVADIYLKKGTALTLPTVVTANYSDGTSKEVPVTWTNSWDVDINTSNIYMVTGNIAEFSGSVSVKVIVSGLAIIQDIKTSTVKVNVSLKNWGDAVAVQYSTNGADWSNYSIVTPTPIVITDNVTLQARSLDAAGNVLETGSLNITNIVKAHTQDGKYYVSPIGLKQPVVNNVLSPATIDNPYYYLNDVLLMVSPGDTIYMRGGTYNYDTTVKITKNQSGQEGKIINVFAYDGEKPAIDFSGQPYDSSSRGIQLNGDYYHFKGIEIHHAGDNGMKIEGSHNVIENCVFHHNKDGGLQIGPTKATVDINNAAFNRVINCDSYLNYDPDTNGGNADGFSCKLFPGQGNSFYGCRAWANSDDGWDMLQSNYQVKIQNCWTWNNGNPANFGNPAGFKSNANGFKLGGDYTHGNHIITNSIAFNNAMKGFDENHQMTGLTAYNNLSFGNGINYSFNESPDDMTKHKVKNNISYAPVSSDANLVAGTIESNNSWDNIALKPVASDFVSLKVEDAMAPRNADGSLPNNGFGKTTGTKFIDKGTPVGMPYTGAAPDLGAFEADGKVITPPTYTKPVISVDTTDANVSQVVVTISNYGDAPIKKYSLDGGISWIDYTGPFNLTKNYVVQAQGSDSIYNSSSDIGILRITNIKVSDTPEIDPSKLDLTKPIGYGRNATGGGSTGQVFKVTTKDELVIALNAKLKNSAGKEDPSVGRIIIIQNDINLCSKNGIEYTPGVTDPKILPWKDGKDMQNDVMPYITKPNTTIMGAGNGVTLSGGGFRTKNTCDNLIIRNINFEDAYDFFPLWDTVDNEWNCELDNLRLDGATNVWIDHCTFSDGKNLEKVHDSQHQDIPIHHDGLLDLKNGADNVTISNCKFMNHTKTSLIGSGDTVASDAGKFHVTFYNNYYYNCEQRLPRLRFGHVHAFNNYYDAGTGTIVYALGVGANATIYSEGNIFNLNPTEYANGTSRPVDIQKGATGNYFEECGSIVNGTVFGKEKLGTNAVPKYDLTGKPDYDYAIYHVTPDNYTTVRDNIIKSAGYFGTKNTPAKIISISPVADTVIQKGGTLSLPKTVIANYDDNTSIPVIVTWTNVASVDINTPGTYSLSGTIADFAGSVTAKVIVTNPEVKPSIVSITTPNSISLEQGSTLTLPTTVTANYSDSTSKQVAVSWTNSVDVNIPGTYIIKGTIAGYTPGVTIQINVTMAPVVQKDFTVASSFNMSSLQAGSLLDVKTAVTNNKSKSGSVIAIVALYDETDKMVNISYISKVIELGKSENLNSGFKLPTNITDYKVKVFVWDGTSLTNTTMLPLSNVVILK
jgi:pectate lyase